MDDDQALMFHARSTVTAFTPDCALSNRNQVFLNVALSNVAKSSLGVDCIKFSALTTFPHLRL